MVQFKGREMQHQSLGKELLANVAKSIAEYAVVENEAKMEGRSMFMIVGPKKGQQPPS